MSKTKTVVCTQNYTDMLFLTEVEHESGGEYWCWGTDAFSAIDFVGTSVDAIKYRIRNYDSLMSNVSGDIFMCDVELDVYFDNETLNVIIPRKMHRRHK